jgi:hypothetical protein
MFILIIRFGINPSQAELQMLQLPAFRSFMLCNPSPIQGTVHPVAAQTQCIRRRADSGVLSQGTNQNAFPTLPKKRRAIKQFV